MQVIVITGSTRGIGRGLAEQLLLRGAAVVLSGRDPAAVATASAALASNSAAERVMGKACDVRDPVQVQALWDAALARFGRVDCWVNNAGCGTLPRRLTDLPASDAERVVGTNQIGTLVCCHVAIAGMEAQGHGFIYNMEGFGSRGQLRVGSTIYGSTKVAIRYLTRALRREYKDSCVRFGTLSPGVVITDAILTNLRSYENPLDRARGKRVLNIIGDDVPTAADFLAARLLRSNRDGVRIARYSVPRLAWRFATAPFRSRDLFASLDV